MNHQLALLALFWANLFLASGLAAQTSPSQSPDSTFLLQSNDPARRPSPFIGNGHLGVVVPALGLGPAPAYMTALFEEAPRDVPRIVRIPGWGVTGLYNGTRWLAADSSPAAAVKDYRQIVDMLLGDTTTQQWLEVAAEEPEFRNDLRDHVSAFKHAHNRTFRHDDCRNGKKLGNRGGRKMSTAQT